jgi:FKBP-type peptidyl-prolyl cis-trans isomerase
MPFCTPLLLALALFAPGNLVTHDTLVGKGPKAESGEILTMMYKGTLKDGTTFDENTGKAPFVFELGAGQVIKGWDEGMKGMRVGGKRHLEIPASMGYGDRTAGTIPPNSTLIFDVELLRIDKKNANPDITITDITKGLGASAKSGDTVRVLYKGMFLNGVKFDSSEDHPDANGKVQPMEVPLGQKKVIAGFEKALIGMKVGGERKVVIPYKLAYGTRDVGNGLIPPMSTLVFELKLVSIGKD